MNAKADQRERSHEAILESASRLLRQKGIAGARVAEVMKGAGLTVGGFYAHFLSKEALVDAAFRKTAAELRARLFARLEEKPAADRAEVVVKRYLSVANRDETLDGCPLPAVVGEVGNSAREHRPVLAEEIERLASELEGHLPSEGRIVPRRHLALGLVALMYGGLSLSRALKGSDLSEEMLKACRAVGRMALRSDRQP